MEMKRTENYQYNKTLEWLCIVPNNDNKRNRSLAHTHTKCSVAILPSPILGEQELLEI